MFQPITLPIHGDFETIERYVVATFARYERVLLTLLPILALTLETAPRRHIEASGEAGFAYVGVELWIADGVLQRVRTERADG